MGTGACLCFSTGCLSAALDPGEAGTRGGGTPCQMHHMTLGEPTSELPTQRQIEALMRYAWNEARVQPPVTPTNILIILLLLLQRIQNGVAAAFWAYIPDPPMIQSLG